jgi:AcrR family transcriptional regulator
VPRKRISGVQLGEASARAMILAAAGAVFARHGVRAASVAQILAEAGVARRTFYRLYQSKEHVMHALYCAGTDALLDACRAAVREERDPLRRLARCIDVHLRNARDLGRLVWVLGGEAQHHESSLHARRMEVFATIASLMAEPDVDPLLYRSVVVALDGVVRLLLEESDEGRRVTPARCERARRVMLRIATATLAGDGPGVAPLPTTATAEPARAPRGT